MISFVENAVNAYSLLVTKTLALLTSDFQLVKVGFRLISHTDDCLSTFRNMIALKLVTCKFEGNVQSVPKSIRAFCGASPYAF